MFIDSCQWFHPSVTLISGPPSSGKTSFCTSVLKKSNLLFKPSAPSRVLLFYSYWQDIYSYWRDEKLVHEFYEGTPEIEEYKKMIKNEGNGTLSIFDDLGGDIEKNLDFYKFIVQVASHHAKNSIFLIVHNLFQKGLRDISINCHRFTLLRSPRDKSQIQVLAKQAFPATGNFLIKAYEDATKNPYGHLLIDFSQQTCDNIRVSTDWFSKEKPIKVYNQKSKLCRLSMSSNNPFVCCYIIPEAIYKSLIDDKKSEGNIDRSNISNNIYSTSNFTNPSSNFFNNQSHMEESDGNGDGKKAGIQNKKENANEETQDFDDNDDQRLQKKINRVNNNDIQKNELIKEKPIITNPSDGHLIDKKREDLSSLKLQPSNHIFKKRKKEKKILAPSLIKQENPMVVKPSANQLINGEKNQSKLKIPPFNQLFKKEKNKEKNMMG